SSDLQLGPRQTAPVANRAPRRRPSSRRLGTFGAPCQTRTDDLRFTRAFWPSLTFLILWHIGLVTCNYVASLRWQVVADSGLSLLSCSHSVPKWENPPRLAGKCLGGFS